MRLLLWASAVFFGVLRWGKAVPIVVRSLQTARCMLCPFSGCCDQMSLLNTAYGCWNGPVVCMTCLLVCCPSINHD